MGPCAKQTVTAIVVAVDGRRFVGSNYCEAPQAVCPRAGMATGEGYALCRSVCRQPAHAERNALALAGDAAKGGVLRVFGHSYACDACVAAAKAAGIVKIEFPEKGSPK